MSYAYDEQTLRHWIDECLNHGRGLTEWEEDFCKSVDGCLKRNGRLTPGQTRILEDIYVEKTK